MATLARHPRPIPRVLPPLEFLTRYVDQASGHWFWREGRNGRSHDAKGQATLRWKTPPRSRTMYRGSGSYNVARLFLEHSYGPLPPRTTVRNICGLPQCVNPAHWALPDISACPYLLAPWGDSNWQVVERTTQLEPLRTVAVRVRLPDTLVHVLIAEPASSRNPGVPLSTVCGKPVAGIGTLIVESAVTCREGC